MSYKIISIDEKYDKTVNAFAMASIAVLGTLGIYCLFNNNYSGAIALLFIAGAIAALTIYRDNPNLGSTDYFHE